MAVTDDLSSFGDNINVDVVVGGVNAVEIFFDRCDEGGDGESSSVRERFTPDMID